MPTILLLVHDLNAREFTKTRIWRNTVSKTGGGVMICVWSIINLTIFTFKFFCCFISVFFLKKIRYYRLRFNFHTAYYTAAIIPSMAAFVFSILSERTAAVPIILYSLLLVRVIVFANYHLLQYRVRNRSVICCAILSFFIAQLLNDDQNSSSSMWYTMIAISLMKTSQAQQYKYPKISFNSIWTFWK